MKCYKCGKEAPLRSGLCNDCYKEILQNKYKKRKKSNNTKNSYILNNLSRNEKILSKAETSRLIYFYILTLFGISIILFPKTIIEFFINGNNVYFSVLIFNILLFFFAIYLVLYFMSRDIYLTDKKIIGKWGLFKLKRINLPLNRIQSIDTDPYTGLEIDTKEKNYFFDFVGNCEKFKFSTINQIQKLIDSADSESVLMTFSHSLQEKLDNYELEQANPNMVKCKCCKELISKESTFCVHCGEPIFENERTADLFLKTLCFILPPFGIILFLLNIGPFPKLAKQCLLSSVISLAIILIGYLSLLSFIL